MLIDSTFQQQMVLHVVSLNCKELQESLPAQRQGPFCISAETELLLTLPSDAEGGFYIAHFKSISK